MDNEPYSHIFDVVHTIRTDIAEGRERLGKVEADTRERLASLEAQLEAHVTNTRDHIKDMKSNLKGVNNKLWAVLLFLLAQGLAIIVPKISAALVE